MPTGQPAVTTSDELDLKQLLKVLVAVKKGDFSVRMPIEYTGMAGKIADTLNDIINLNERMTDEFARISTVVGKEGRITQRASLGAPGGSWSACVDSVNTLITDLAQPTTEMTRVIGAVARGDLSQTIDPEIDGRPLEGEFLRTGAIVNTMVDQLNSFASEVIRVAREVGTEGKLGGQAEVKGVAGVWKDLTDNVNFMAGNLTAQVRGIARVVTAVANGDLKRKLALEVKGEIATLADTINEMIDTLATFADQVTTVAREVGIEGKLGGQAKVPGAAGTWRDLTDNVNQLAANLTTQIRTIAEIATAVTKGDLTRSIAVEAQGEVAELKDNINQMIANLRDTTQKNTEQDWLKTNLARFTRMLQGQRDLETVSKLILSELAPLVFAQAGLFYVMDGAEQPALRLLSTYAYRERRNLSNQFRMGEGLVGQCALEKERILITDVPSDYIKISSGLGESAPLNIVALPVVFEGQVKAVIELGSFHRFSETHLNFLDQLTESIAIVLNTIAASMRTEELLKQSQSLAEELQGQQQELTETNKRLEQQARSLQASEELLKQQREQLQQTNEELEEKAELLSRQNAEVERKNVQIELARRALEEKAEQLEITSKYKNEFLANMSHELRTPLNSLLILSRLLSENPDGNLSPKQVEFATTIHSAGSELLMLINDILDLAKIESGTMTVETDNVRFADLCTNMEQTFAQIARNKGIEFAIDLDASLPEAITTDTKRLQQVLKNLLSNAFKFTDQGHVRLQIAPATEGWNAEHAILNAADQVFAFTVSDTGIGIPADKQQIIFEAFQQADGTTSRKYGGTGLGLSISREIARLLGGEIRLVSSPGAGSTFTLYLPGAYQPTSEQPSSSNGEHAIEPARPRSGELRPAAARAANSTTLPMLVLPDQQTIADDRAGIAPGDRVFLIIEDDPSFARILLDMAREKGFKGLVALRGDVGLAMANSFKPDAITLDIELPTVGGWTIFDRLKHDPQTRHIPIHIISVSDERQRGMHMGALAFLQKPATPETLREVFASARSFIERTVKNLLVVEDDQSQRESIVQLIGNGDIATTAVGTGAEALAALESERFDCLVLDIGLPDISGIDLINRIKREDRLANLPIVVYTGKDLSRKETTELKRLADTVIVKDVASLDRLLYETALFLHRAEANLPPSTRQILEQLHRTDTILAGKCVLIIDDDVRNIFALTSVLERYGMQVLYAENGRDGIAVLQHNPDVDIILMDVMMPEMDGYETMRSIRKTRKYKGLPIIALTAKAMQGDREKCIDAGASDYITKPVDTDQLLSLLRVWLYK